MNYIAIVIAVICLGCNIYSFYHADELRALRLEYQQRQVVVSNLSTFQTVNQQLIKALASSAVNNNDTALRDLLASEGVTYSVDGSGRSTIAQPGQGGSSNGN